MPLYKCFYVGKGCSVLIVHFVLREKKSFPSFSKLQSDLLVFYILKIALTGPCISLVDKSISAL